MTDKTNSYFGDFIAKNVKTIISCVIFLCGLCVQYQASMMRINQLEVEMNQIKVQLNDQYVKLDNMKLDKAVFEATMKQFSDMSTDIRQIRDRLEDILGDHERHQPQIKKNAEGWR